VEALEAKRVAVETEYKAMKPTELVERLEADSRQGVEPFNSLAYRELVARGPQVGQELSASLRTPDRSALLTLLTLRRVNEDLYRAVDPKLSVEILVDALRTSEYFNAWGLPHLYWEDAAQAIVEQGPTAVGPLKALLRDKRDAPMWGSEEVIEYETYGYRVCDYAWALVMEIRDEKREIPVDPLARDALISAELEKID
jgi:hypothetical protein